MALDLFHQDIGAGRPLVILHGLFGSLDNWNTLAKRWARDLRVVSVDLRNHGRSPHDPSMTYADMVDDLRVLFERLDLHDAVLLGHSMGGKAAMAYAAAHPDRLGGLIVADIAPRTYPPGHTTIFQALRSVDLSAFDERGDVDDALSEGIPVQAVRQFLMKGLRRRDNGSFAWKFNLSALWDHYQHLIGAIQLPTPAFDRPSLVLHGGRSDYVTASDRETFSGLYPDVRFHTVEGAGHWVHAEKPREVEEVVRGFAG